VSKTQRSMGFFILRVFGGSSDGQKPTYEELEQRIKELESEDFDRKQAEESLWESEAVHRRLIDKLDDIVWTLDLDLRTTYVSPSIEKKLGFTPEERMAQDPGEQMTPTSYARMSELLI